MFVVKKLLGTFLFVTFLCMICVADEPKTTTREPLIVSHSLLDSDFSLMESTPIIKAFFNWTVVTNGDILVLPPTDEDVEFFENSLSGNITNAEVIMADFRFTAKDIWGPLCNQTFYILRINSKNSVIKEIEEARGGKTLAITFHGCKYKFIAVVSDRIESEKMMYDVMSHELGHMWGLDDNDKGENSIMSGHYPVSNCITKNDIKTLYHTHGIKLKDKENLGCEK